MQLTLIWRLFFSDIVYFSCISPVLYANVNNQNSQHILAWSPLWTKLPITPLTTNELDSLF